MSEESAEHDAEVMKEVRERKLLRCAYDEAERWYEER
jgi:hypothetical protein